MLRIWSTCSLLCSTNGQISVSISVGEIEGKKWSMKYVPLDMSEKMRAVGPLFGRKQVYEVLGNHGETLKVCTD